MSGVNNYLSRLRNGFIQGHSSLFDIFFNLTVKGVSCHILLLEGKAFPWAQFQQLWPSFVHLIYMRFEFGYQLSQLLQQTKQLLSITGSHLHVTAVYIPNACSWKEAPNTLPITRHLAHGSYESLPGRDAPDTKIKQQSGHVKVPRRVYIKMLMEQNPSSLSISCQDGTF